MQNLRLRFAGALTALLACLALSACDDINKSGYGNAQKAQIAALVRPDAIKLTAEVLRLGTPTLSDDGKSFLIDVGSHKADSYSAFVEIRKTSPKPDPTQVISISLEHWVPDPTKPGQTTQDSTVDIDSGGDHINTDAYWAVDSMDYLKPGSDKDSDRLFASNLPVHEFDSGKMDMQSVLGITKSIMDEVRTVFEPGLLHSK